MGPRGWVGGNGGKGLEVIRKEGGIMEEGGRNGVREGGRKIRLVHEMFIDSQ